MISQSSLTLKPYESVGIMSRRVRRMLGQSFDTIPSLVSSTDFTCRHECRPSIRKTVSIDVSEKTYIDDLDQTAVVSFVSTDSKSFTTNMEEKSIAESLSQFSMGSSALSLSDDPYEHFFEEIAKCPSLSDVTSEDSFDAVSSKFSHLRKAESIYSARLMTMPTVVSEISHYSSDEATEEEKKEEKTDFFFENFDEKYEDKIGFGSSPEKTLENLGNFIHADEVVGKFLDDLFNEIELFCKDKKPKHLQIYNKMALVEELRGLVDEMYISIRIRTFLRRKAIDYYRRRGKLRYITPEDDAAIDDNVKRLETAVCYLNEVLVLEKGIAERSTQRISQLEEIASFQEEMLKDELHNLEKMFINTVNYGNRFQLNEIAEKALKEMATLRHEISGVFSKYMLQQNKVSKLKLKIDDLNDLGEGLRLHSYENLLMEVRALEKKNEEKKNFLVKKREILNHTWNATGHHKLARDLLTIKTETEKRTLGEQMRKKLIYRKRFHDLKVVHERTRKALKDLTAKCGILAKPDLLRDYDETVENIEMKKRNIEILRQTRNDLEAKMQKLEKSVHIP